MIQESNRHVQLQDLLRSLSVELDIEYSALQQEQISLILVSRIRQNELQARIEHTISKDESWRGHSEWIQRIQSKIQRNLKYAQKLRLRFKEELDEIGNFRRIQRQFFPQKSEKNTPVLIDIRR